MDGVTVPALRNGHHDTSYPTYFPLTPQQRSIASSLLLKKAGVEAVPSLTCRDCQPSDAWRVYSVIEDGLENVLVVYGDPCADPAIDRYHFRRTDQLIRHIAQVCNGNRPSIGAVTNQYAKDPEREIARTLARVDAGADFILTNISFEEGPVLSHRDRLLSAGLDVPLLIQVSIPHSLENIRFVSEKFGIPVPERVRRRLVDGTPGAGVGLASEAYDALHREASGIHFSYLFRKRNPIPAYRALLDTIRAETVPLPVSRVGG